MPRPKRSRERPSNVLNFPIKVDTSLAELGIIALLHDTLTPQHVAERLIELAGRIRDGRPEITPHESMGFAVVMAIDGAVGCLALCEHAPAEIYERVCDEVWEPYAPPEMQPG